SALILTVAVVGTLTVTPCSSSVTAAPPNHPESVAQRYLAIARPANDDLEQDFDALHDSDSKNLGQAQAALRRVAQVERTFDRKLLQIRFWPAVERVARRLVRSNEARADLTSLAATSTSLRDLRSWEPGLNGANVPVETGVRTIRHQLGLPPPETS